MGIGRNGADDLHAAETIHVRGVHERDVDVAGLRMLADVADGGVQNDLAVLHHIGVVGTALAGDILAGLALVVASRRIHANGGERLSSVVASRNGVVADADGVLAISDVLQRDVLHLGAFLRHHHEIVLEHVDARGPIHIALGNRGVHGALGSGDEQVGIRAGAKHLVELAGRLVLGVLEGDVVVAVLDVGLLDVFHGLGERVCGEDLELNRLGLFGLGGIVLLLRGGVAAGAAEHRERPDEREREHGGQHQAYLLLHVFLPLSGRIRAPPKGEGPQYIVLRSSSGLHESKPSMHRHIPFRCTDT